MTCFITDVLVQKKFERQIGRPLTAEEIEADEPFLAIDLRGNGIWVSVPTLVFPRELLLSHEGDYQANKDLFDMLCES